MNIRQLNKTSEGACQQGCNDTNNNLRVYVVTEEDPLYVQVFFEKFLKHGPPRNVDIVGAAVCKAFNESRIKTLIRAVNFFGLNKAVRQILRMLNKQLRNRTVRRSLEAHTASILSPNRINAPIVLRDIAATKPDIILSVAAPERFGTELLSIPSVGCINVHSGKLPEYRGMMPVFWQLHDKQEQIVVTVHTMTEKLDVGIKLAEQHYTVTANDTLDSTIKIMKELGATAVTAVLEELHASRRLPDLPPHTCSRGQYHSFPTKADVKRLIRSGRRLV